MGEMTGFEIVIKTLGEKIAALETDVRYERALKEEAKKKAEKLETMCAKLNNECEAMRSKLAEVERYIKRMEE